MLKKALLIVGFLILTVICLWSFWLKNYLGKASLGSLSLNKSELVLKNLALANDRFSFSAEKIKIPLFSKKPKILVKPQLVINKRRAFKKKRKIFSLSNWLIEEGKVELNIKGEAKKELFFSSSPQKSVFGFEKKKLNQIEYYFADKSLVLKEVPLKKLSSFARLWLNLEDLPFIDKVEGSFSGKGRIDNQEKILLELNFKNLAFLEKRSLLQLSFASVEMTIEKKRLEPWAALDLKGSFQQGRVLEDPKVQVDGFFVCKKGELVFSLGDKSKENPWFLEGNAFLKEKSYHLRLKRNLAELIFQKRVSGKCALSGQNIDPTFGNLLQAFLKKRYPNCLDYRLKSGLLSFYAEWSLKKKMQIKISELTGEKIEIIGRHNLFLKNLSGRADIDFRKKEPLRQVNLKIEGEYLGKIFDKKLELKKGVIDFSAKNGVIDPSFFTFNLNGFKGQLKCFGKEKELKAFFSGRGKVKEFLALDDEMSCSLSFKREKGAVFSGLLQLKEKVLGNQTLSFGLELKELAFRKLISNQWREVISSFWLKAEKLNLDKWSSFFNFKDAELKGRANLSCFYQAEEMSLDFQGEKLYFKNPVMEISLPKMGSVEDFFLEEYLSLNYDFKKAAFSVKSPPLKGSFSFFEYGLGCLCQTAQLKTSGSNLRLEVEEGVLNGINLSGAIEFDWFNRKKWSVEATKARGEVKDLYSLLKNFGIAEKAILSNLNGSFVSDKSFFLEKNLESETALWRLNLSFFNLGFLGESGIKGENFQGQVIWNSQEEKLILAKVEGELNYLQQKFIFKAPWIQKKGQRATFDLRVEKSALEMARFFGSALFVQERIALLFDQEKSHLLGQDFKVKNCIFTGSGLQSCDVAATLPLKEAALYGCLIGENLDYRSFSGLIKSHLVFQKEKELLVTLEGKKINLLHKPFQSFYFQARKGEKGLEIEDCQLDNWEIKGILTKDLTLENGSLKGKGCCMQGRVALKPASKKIEGTFSSLVLSEEAKPLWAPFIQDNQALQVALQGSGYWSLNFQKGINVDCDLDLEKLRVGFLEYAFENKEPLNLHFNSREGVQMRGLNLLIEAPSCNLRELVFKVDFCSLDADLQKWQMQKAHLSFPSALLQEMKNKVFMQIWKKCKPWLHLEKQIDLLLDLEGASDFSSVRGSADEISLQINDQRQHFKKVIFKKEKNFCFFKSQMELGELYHPVESFFFFAQPLSGYLAIGVDQRPLKIFFEVTEEALEIKKVQGKYSGLQADFVFSGQEGIDDYTLLGSLKIDVSKTLNWLFPEWKDLLGKLQLGSGFQIQGKMKLLKEAPKLKSFQGQLLGKDLEVSGYRLKSLSSDLEIREGHIALKNFILSDMAGRLNLKGLLLEKKNQKWHFSLPYIGLFEFRPSLLVKTAEEKQKQTPLLIRRAEFFDLHGQLDDIKTVTGIGNLNFINSFKRGYNVLEIPADFLGSLVGLDSELLIPVAGYLDLEIKEGRLSLETLKEAYSENRRSEFFLIQPSFIDLKGNLNLNFKMKQDVLLKITENFILSLRGTVFKPKLKMAKKRRLLRC